MSIEDLFAKIAGARRSGAPEYIIAGLGNPGKEYEGTRHNAGFLALDSIAEKCDVKVNRAKYQALYAETVIAGHSVLLIKPQTFMNNSGAAVSEAAKFYKMQNDHVIIICDDITQIPGKMRVRRCGSAGGHNGLKSIIECLGSNEFPRIRLGIGEKPNPEYDLADWVTGKFSPDDKKALTARFQDVYHAVELIIGGDIEKAMCDCNG